MNCSNGLVIETDGARRENRPPHFASDARSQVGSTLETSGNRPLCLNKASDELCQLAPDATHQTVGDIRGELTVRFSEAWRRRSIVLQEKRPWRAVWSPGSGASSTRPRPGYPLLVCSPAMAQLCFTRHRERYLTFGMFVQKRQKPLPGCRFKIDKSAYRVVLRNLVNYVPQKRNGRHNRDGD